ncbi:hypothetical protein ACJX0J_005654, partial [Zea mays]
PGVEPIILLVEVANEVVDVIYCTCRTCINLVGYELLIMLLFKYENNTTCIMYDLPNVAMKIRWFYCCLDQTKHLHSIEIYDLIGHLHFYFIIIAIHELFGMTSWMQPNKHAEIVHTIQIDFCFFRDRA